MSLIQTAEFSTEKRLLALPKVELHVHLEGFVDLAFWREMTKAQGTWTIQRDQEMVAHFGFTSFPAFLKCFGAVIFSFSDPGDFYRLTQRALNSLNTQGVRYAEVMLSPSFFVNRGIDFGEMLSEIHRATQEAETQGGPKIKLIFDGPRNFGLDAVWQTFKLAALDTTGLVIGVGLGGDEANFPARDFCEPFAWAKAQGLRATCHAGETSGESSIFDAVTLLGAERIGHALGITQGGAVESLILEKNIGLDLCPHSNVTTGVLTRLEDHPLADYINRGFELCLNSDDPGFFRTELMKEYLWAKDSLGLRWAQIHQICRNSINQSFLSSTDKQTLLTELAAAAALETPGM